MFSLKPDNLEREATTFVAYARDHPGDPGVARYLPVVGKLREASASGSHRAWFPFMEAEMWVQRQLLLGTLNRVRGAWAKMQGDPAEGGTR
jgi:hypothetical protein